jgi:FMN phosphatase YigB (HAD superfamily)
VAVSLDLFGTLVAVDRPSDPAAAVGRELAARGVPPPGDWERAYRERHRQARAGAEVPLSDHVAAALASRGVDAPAETVDGAVLAAFTRGSVRTRDGAHAVLAGLAGQCPVGLCSNCSVRGLVDWALAESALETDVPDAVITSVDCGWRKPDRRAFAAVADALGVGVPDLVHVGDDPVTDGGVTDAGGEYVDVRDVALSDLPEVLEGRAWD